MKFICMIEKEKAKKIIGENIRAYREQTLLDQDDLAVLALNYPNDETGRHKGQVHISLIECGNQPPTVLELYLISKILKRKIEDFLIGIPHQ